MWVLRAENEPALEEISGAIHDAYFDPGLTRYEPETAAFIVPFQQEGWTSGPTPHEEFVKETWRIRESRAAAQLS